jgi:hypothetical protein
MGNSVVLENVSSEELKTLIKSAIREEMSSIPQVKEEGFITRHELSEKLHLSLVSVDKYIRLGKLKGYRIGGRVLFKESEIKLDEIPSRKIRR